MKNPFNMFKKGQTSGFGLAALGAIGLFLTLGGLIVTYSGDIVDDVSGDQTANSAAANISGNTLAGLTNFSDQFGTIGTIAGVAILLTVLIQAFGGLLRGR